jgi:hypothetical protein
MKKHSLAWLVVTVLVLPASLRACDCGCDGPPKVVIFKDGLTPNGPVTAEARYGDTEYYTTSFGFRDYGPARVAPPPVAPSPLRRPSS